MPWHQWVDDQLAAIRAAGQWRHTRSFDALGPTGVLGGREVVSFASNDYLGLSAHPAVIDAAVAAASRWGAGSTASRLIVGSRPAHEELEADLAEWRGCEAAVVFSTGYAANLGVLATVGGNDVTILSDELNHASIIDGCRLSRSRIRRFRHGDLDHVTELLATAAGRRVVVTDTVFSMDGDVAPVAELQALCARHGALLVLDEAHAVLGPDVESSPETIRVGTLSKSLGALGGFVAASQPFVDLLVNRARSYIFTTAPSPADMAAALAALRVLRSEEGGSLVGRLRAVVQRVAPGHPSPIVPFVVGEEAEAVAAADALLARGLLVPAIRPPTVAPGSSRLRVALSAAHDDAMIDRLLEGLSAVGLRP
ncbi:MAG TPA: 8-amino-7-oxononanoate synthase [Acidimicrobiales bacterium]|jgi:8-amino-7-oxononanoate synthase|nr:8-amino-7-oxononanoate synthase [Acidimicrobiales bacterium]